MKISEIFYSVQGEIDVGVPSVFLRLSGCNLECGFCDTRYHTNSTEMSSSEVEKQLRQYDCDNVVVTGGEPLLQSRELGGLVSQMKDKHWCIETNGTLYDPILEEFDKISCSIKKQSIRPDVISQLNSLDSVRFKFVYEDRNDRWWENVIRDNNLSDKSKIWIMPEGQSREEQNGRMEEVVDYCIKKGYSFSPRLQVLLWDTRRKV